MCDLIAIIYRKFHFSMRKTTLRSADESERADRVFTVNILSLMSSKVTSSSPMSEFFHTRRPIRIRIADGASAFLARHFVVRPFLRKITQKILRTTGLYNASRFPRCRRFEMSSELASLIGARTTREKLYEP